MLTTLVLDCHYYVILLYNMLTEKIRRPGSGTGLGFLVFWEMVKPTTMSVMRTAIMTVSHKDVAVVRCRNGGESYGIPRLLFGCVVCRHADRGPAVPVLHANYRRHRRCGHAGGRGWGVLRDDQPRPHRVCPGQHRVRPGTLAVAATIDMELLSLMPWVDNSLGGLPSTAVAAMPTASVVVEASAPAHDPGRLPDGFARHGEHGGAYQRGHERGQSAAAIYSERYFGGWPIGGHRVGLRVRS